MKTIAKILKTIGQKSAMQAAEPRCHPYIAYQPVVPKKLQEQIKNNK